MFGGGRLRRLKSPNRWSCLATSFAMVLDVPLEELIEEIGHDGSEVIFPDLPEPLRRRAFHVQELIDCAIRRGVSVTPIEGLPAASPDSRHTITLPQRDPSRRLRDYLVFHKGVLTGLSQSGNPHAVAWLGDDRCYYDPKDAEPHPLETFSIQTFWMCTRMCSSSCLD